MTKVYWDKPKEKKKETIVVLLHNYGGDYRSTRKAREFFLSQGYECLSFSLGFSKPSVKTLFLKKANVSYGLRHYWSNEIYKQIKLIEKPMIFYTMSFPSTSAHQAMAKKNYKNIKAWITDGGPFVDSIECTWNLFTYAFRIKNVLLRAIQVALSLVAINGFQNYKKDIVNYFSKAPKKFPILAFSAEEDKLVPEKSLVSYFSLSTVALEFEVVTVKGVGHLQGFYKQKELMADNINRFLKKHKL